MKKTNLVILFKVLSQRLNKDGQPYVDYYLVSKPSEVVRQVRVQKVFRCDGQWFDDMAVKVDSVAEFAKYF